METECRSGFTSGGTGFGKPVVRLSIRDIKYCLEEVDEERKMIISTRETDDRD